jgi:TonB family protein
MINISIGNYRIVRLIGEGGMAAVYEAEHNMLGTKVAIKVLKPILSSNAQIKERFRNEAKLMASLDHPNIIKVIDFDDQPNQLSIVMEYLMGEDLNQKIKRNGALNAKDTIDIFAQTLDAFQYAHDKGIVHRDIKPSNIFILANGRVKILDFGIAKLFGQSNEMTQTGTQMGTPIYMSPEQVKADKSIDHRSDIYSLGVTMYYAVNGRAPYNSETESQFDIFNKIVFEPLPDFKIKNEFTEGIIKACQKNKADRFQNCRDWSESLLKENRKAERNEDRKSERNDERTIIDQILVEVEQKKSAPSSIKSFFKSLIKGKLSLLTYFTLALTIISSLGLAESFDATNDTIKISPFHAEDADYIYAYADSRISNSYFLLFGLIMSLLYQFILLNRLIQLGRKFKVTLFKIGTNIFLWLCFVVYCITEEFDGLPFRPLSVVFLILATLYLTAELVFNLKALKDNILEKIEHDWKLFAPQSKKLKRFLVCVWVSFLVTVFYFAKSHDVRLDRDLDGVPNDLDKCIYSMGNIETHGCPDTDQDGVLDCDDSCPQVYGKGSNGCDDSLGTSNDIVTLPQNKTSTDQTQTTAQTQTQPSALDNMLNGGEGRDASTGGGSGGTGGGDGGGNGPGSGKFTGSGFGNGTSWSLKGRGSLSGPSTNKKPTANGEVIASITVDKNGRVTKASIMKSSITTDVAFNHSLALEAARKCTFTASSTSMPQSGTITIVLATK